ncbi:MAG TPA: ABC transporter permease [Rectinemataceae bacterium]|nr:ABC transporter permease [Rectinemataceae bacterium]
MSVEHSAHAGAAAHLGPRRSARSMTFGTWYVTEHRLRTMRAYLSSILMGSVFNPVMYLFALGVGIGSYIDASSGSKAVGAVGYLTFVGPALLASAALTVAFEESSFPVLGGFKWTREFWAMNATPISARQVANGVLLAAGLRVVFTVAIFWCCLALFGATPSPLSALAMPSAIMGGLAFGSVIMWVASRLEEDDGWFAMINRLIIAPMFLFSGTFFPLDRLPLGLQWIGWISPLWHATQLGRVATYGMPEPPWLSLVHAAFLTLLFAAGMALSWRSFARRLAR